MGGKNKTTTNKNTTQQITYKGMMGARAIWKHYIHKKKSKLTGNWNFHHTILSCTRLMLYVIHASKNARSDQVTLYMAL